jgi:hypothetical protein
MSDSTFFAHFLLLAVFPGFKCILGKLIALKRKSKAKEFLTGPDLASNKAFY